MAFERFEVAIIVQQLVLVLDAVRRDGQVSEGSDGDPTSPKPAIMRSADKGQAGIEHRLDPVGVKLALEFEGLFLAAQAAKQLKDDDVSDDDQVGRKPPEADHFLGRNVPEVIDPD